MNRALLDTDTYSEVLKRVDRVVANNAATYRAWHGKYAIAAITLMEIVQGLHRVKSARRMQAFLNAVALEEVIPFGRTAAELAGRIVGDLHRTGQPIGRADPMIAAVAMELGLELVTGNTNHYQRIQNLGYPLVLNNWRF